MLGTHPTCSLERRHVTRLSAIFQHPVSMAVGVLCCALSYLINGDPDLPGCTKVVTGMA